MQDAFELTKDLDLNISLETDLPPIDFQELLENIGLDHVQANYDIGNSASLGFDPREEIEAYGLKILNVHIKDRKLGSTTVPLGTGNANIKYVIQKLQEIGYSGGLTMQAARGENDVETAKEQLKYIKYILNSL
jgi:hexulose-6-phosphate isomerase